MVKRKFIVIISGIVLVLLLSVAAIYVIKNKSNKNTINELLIEADDSLSSGYYNKAEGFLNTASKKAESSNQFIKILNKAFLIAIENNNFNLFYIIAERAYGKFTDSGRITLLTAYGRIRTGKISSAYEILTKSRFKSVQLKEIKKSLLDELSVRYHVDLLKQKKEYDNDLYSAAVDLKNADPLVLEKIGTKYGNDLLLKDASLLWAKQGDIPRAIDTLLKAGNDKQFTGLMALYSYDTGDFKHAVAFMDSLLEYNPERIDILLLKADALYQNGQYKDALILYMKIIKGNHAFSWTPYYNTALLYEIYGNYKAAIKVLNRCLKIFPDEKYPGLLLLHNYVLSDNIPAARKVLTNLIVRFPGDNSLNLMELKLNSENYPPVRYEAEIRKLFNSNPSDNDITVYLIQYLLEMNDPEEAQKVLMINMRANRGIAKEWWYGYRGIINAELGKLEDARTDLLKSISLFKKWDTYYNLSVVEKHEGLYREALVSLKNAENLLKSGSSDKNKNIRISRIRYLTGELYYMLGNISSSRRELNYSVQLNRNNLSSILLLKKLEDEIK